MDRPLDFAAYRVETDTRGATAGVSPAVASRVYDDLPLGSDTDELDVTESCQVHRCASHEQVKFTTA